MSATVSLELVIYPFWLRLQLIIIVGSSLLLFHINLFVVLHFKRGHLCIKDTDVPFTTNFRTDVDHDFVGNILPTCTCGIIICISQNWSTGALSIIQLLFQYVPACSACFSKFIHVMSYDATEMTWLANQIWSCFVIRCVLNSLPISNQVTSNGFGRDRIDWEIHHMLGV